METKVVLVKRTKKSLGSPCCMDQPMQQLGKVHSILPARDPHDKNPRYGREIYIDKYRRINGKDLQQWRRGNGCSLREAATVLQVSVSTIRKIEAGKQQPGTHLSERIREAIKLANGEGWDNSTVVDGIV